MTEQGRRALASLEGLSVGDAFGQTFFGDPDHMLERIKRREIRPDRWTWTDDTAMALSIVHVLHESDGIDQDLLARTFGSAYRSDRNRGYGPAMFGLLEEYVTGPEWRVLAQAQFGGQGSFGNGCAMRVAPVGAYFADDLDRAAAEATASAIVTHAHPEAVAGAIGVAVAASLAASTRLSGSDYVAEVATRVPPSEVQAGLRRAAELAGDAPIWQAVAFLGNGSEISAQDTVPFCVWCAAHHLDDFEEALWTTVSALGDRDTTCAIVAGIVASRVGREGIPEEWVSHREPLPAWTNRLT